MTYPYEVSKAQEEILKNNVMFGGPWRGPLITSGKGAYCYDRDGREYLDCESQAWSLGLGFGNEEILEAVFEQAKHVYHIKGGLNTFPRLRLVEKILELVPDVFDRVSFEPSGSIANEAAFKLSLINKPKARYFLSLYYGFSGNTLATAAASWHATKVFGHKYGGGVKYLGFMENFIKVPNPYCYRCIYGEKYPGCNLTCAKQLEATVKYGVPGPVAALILEPVQASGGQIPCPPEYLKEVRRICDEHDIILIFDEIQTGFGRMGTMFAMDYYNVIPDIATIGKAMGSGFPIAGTILKKDLLGFQDGTDDNFTYCNNPLSQTAALKTIEILIRDNIPENAKKIGELLTKGFKEMQKDYPIMGDVRGPGLHIGIEMVKDPVTKEPAVEETQKIYDIALEKGLLLGLGGASPHLVKIKPPLIITEEEANKLLERFEDTLKEFYKQK